MIMLLVSAEYVGMLPLISSFWSDRSDLGFIHFVDVSKTAFLLKKDLCVYLKGRVTGERERSFTFCFIS